MPNKIILDTDPGIDDALAIILAVNSPEIELIGITTTYGNVEIEKAVRNTFRILNFIGRLDVPVYRGAYKPIIEEPHTIDVIHGSDGLGDIDIPAVDMEPAGDAVEFMIKAVNMYPHEITIVSIGPLTNLALAILIDPEFPNKVGKIISMGGAFGLTPYGYGNDTPVAEFNIYSDPEAAKIVYDSGAEVYAIGLDVTNNPKTMVSPEEREKIRVEGGRIGKLFYEMTRSLAKLSHGIHLHDPVALSYAIDREILSFKKYWVTVELVGRYTRGQTILDRREGLPGFLRETPNIYVAYDVDGDAFKKLMWNRVFSR